MVTWWKSKYTLEKLLRITADAVMIVFALAIGYTLRFLSLITLENNSYNAYTLFNKLFIGFLGNLWIITSVCVLVLGIIGIYSHRRFYQGKYKAFVVFQGVSVSYLVISTVGYLFPVLITIPRSVILMGWAITVVLLITARLWSVAWKHVIHSETSLQLSENRKNRKKRILVIGGGGYVGSALLPKLLNKGYEVRLLDLQLFGDQPIQGILDHPNLKLIKADFRQVDAVVSAAKGMDAIIHLGAIVGDPACALDEDLTIDINLMATRMIAEVAKGYGIERFIFASTCSVYGAGDEILDEKSALNPVSLYARSKIASEQILMQLADDDFAPTIMRFGTIYGLSGRTRFDLVINLLTAMAAIDGKINIFSGDQWRPFVHVDDVASALMLTLEAPHNQVRNEVFNVGTNEQNYTIDDIGKKIHRLVPDSIIINISANGDCRDYRVDFKKIEKVLNFKANWTVEEGINQVLNSIRKQEVIDYKETIYNNFKFFKIKENHRMMARESDWVYDLLKDPNELMSINGKFAPYFQKMTASK